MTKGQKNNKEIEENVGGDNVDTIRDILFGSQMKEIERKHHQLENQISESLSSLHQDNLSQLENLQSYVESEIDIASSKLESEQNTRESQLDELDSKYQKAFKQLEQKIDDLAKSIEENAQETNKKLLKMSQDFNSDLLAKAEELKKRADSQQQALSTGKVDKNALAEMLNTLAIQLTSDT